jgi:hypothetical protein
LVGNTEGDVEVVVVNVRIAAEKVLVAQSLSNAQDPAELLFLVRRFSPAPNTDNRLYWP